MYKKILVPLDGSDTAERGLLEAMRMASELKATLVLLHVIDDFPMLVEMASVQAYEETMAHLRSVGQRLLDGAQKSAEESDVAAETRLREITRERVGQAIVEEAGAAGCDLIVMGTHGRRGFNRVMMGSDAEFVARASTVPVLLVRSVSGT
ncbi:universal stress protein UspA [Rhodoferax koreense]|uniref:Universal stress protein UspA n=1 Tax=Rhodoferax koreensis TaxID=1842727 RepID=A0A1P8JU45_9BURK|nr:universal stress protein [Rhodoferax koreense]APW37272.1 universal stress protein UspA [Rhodoferax koreense]